MRLELSKIVKTFGPKLVLDQVSFSADSGFALGLLGRNGAGKTTAIRTIMNVFPPDSGEILLDGQELRHTPVRIGYLPEEKGLYPKIKVQKQLLYLAELKGLKRAAAKKQLEYWYERMEMENLAEKKLETLSKGNQQKIQLMAALLGQPEIIILDEPFSGLDPVNVHLLREVVQEQVKQGKIILFSSHQMNYVETFCDKIALLHEGRIILAGSIRDIKRTYERNRVRVSFVPTDLVEDATTVLQKLKEKALLPASVQMLTADGSDCIVTLNSEKDSQNLLESLIQAGPGIEQFSVVEPTLEQIFVEKTKDSLTS